MVDRRAFALLSYFLLAQNLSGCLAGGLITVRLLRRKLCLHFLRGRTEGVKPDAILALVFLAFRGSIGNLSEIRLLIPAALGPLRRLQIRDEEALSRSHSQERVGIFARLLFRLRLSRDRLGHVRLDNRLVTLVALRTNGNLNHDVFPFVCRFDVVTISKDSYLGKHYFGINFKFMPKILRPEDLVCSLEELNLCNVISMYRLACL
jgi:hypothetical protein